MKTGTKAVFQNGISQDPWDFPFFDVAIRAEKYELAGQSQQQPGLIMPQRTDLTPHRLTQNLRRGSINPMSPTAFPQPAFFGGYDGILSNFN